MKSAQIRTFSGPNFNVLGLNTEKYGAEKTRYLDTFYTMYGVKNLHRKKTQVKRKTFDVFCQQCKYL